jgi:predicted nucleic acid-binding protein
MADCVVDTNVVSYLFRGDTRADPYREFLAGKRLAISFMTVAELRSWALIRNWGAQRRTRLDWELRRFSIRYADDSLCEAWATIISNGDRMGRQITAADGWIAAPAWLDNIPLVTHNRRHFKAINELQIISFENRLDLIRNHRPFVSLRT